MVPSTRVALERADDATAWEFPTGFDYRDQMARAQALLRTLESRLCLPVEIDTSVQDASFFTQLSILDLAARPEKGVLSNLALGIRLSSFGGLATVWSCCREGSGLPRSQRQLVVDLLAESGYQYVPAEDLDEPYDGVHAKLRAAGVTWWIRFFDYL